MPIVAGIDPGPEESAYVYWDGEKILMHGNMKNEHLLYVIPTEQWKQPNFIAIEQIRGFGIPAGNKLFDTCFWTGRFVQAFGEEIARLVERKLVIAHLCGTGRVGKDQFVREALIDRIGQPGTKKAPGPTYGITGHEWAALAVAVTFLDLLADPY